MKHHTISAGGALKLHVVETGNSKGCPILFIHGFSQCWLTWTRQLNSDLADDHRLIAIDLRGHGLSDKPREGYTDSRLWANDVNAVIKTLALDHPILCGWSYASLFILDYIRNYGEDGIGGINFICGITKFGSDEAMSFINPEPMNLVPGFLSTDAAECVQSLEAFLRMFFVEEPSTEELYLMLGYNISVPPYVRQALFARSVDNDDLLSKIRKPVLITFGETDRILKPKLVDHQKARIAHAEIHVMSNAGHAPFWDDATSFNKRLGKFCESVAKN